MLHLISDL